MQHPIERDRVLMTHPRRDPVRQLLEHDRRNPGHIEPACLRDWQPDELYEFLVGSDKTILLARNRRYVGSEEAAVEPQRPARRRNGAGDKMDCAQIRRDAGLDKSLPWSRSNAQTA